MNSSAVDAYTALKMATRNGARALGRLHNLGNFIIITFSRCVSSFR